MAAATLAAVVSVTVVSIAKVLGAGSNSRAAADSITGAAAAQPRVARTKQSTTAATPEWAARLYDTTCPDDCLGGTACSATGNKSCPSKFKCIPGTSEDRLEPDLPLNLRLSGIVPLDAMVNFCALNTIVCFKPVSTRALTCIPLSDACGHEGRSTEAVAVRTRDLVSDGVGISVHLGSTATPPIATGAIRYGSYIARVGLCKGFIVGGLSNNNADLSIKYVTYFIEPRS